MFTLILSLCFLGFGSLFLLVNHIKHRSLAEKIWSGGYILIGILMGALYIIYENATYMMFPVIFMASSIIAILLAGMMVAKLVAKSEYNEVERSLNFVGILAFATLVITFIAHLHMIVPPFIS